MCSRSDLFISHPCLPTLGTREAWASALGLSLLFRFFLFCSYSSLAEKSEGLRKSNDLYLNDVSVVPDVWWDYT